MPELRRRGTGLGLDGGEMWRVSLCHWLKNRGTIDFFFWSWNRRWKMTKHFGPLTHEVLLLFSHVCFFLFQTSIYNGPRNSLLSLVVKLEALWGSQSGDKNPKKPLLFYLAVKHKILLFCSLFPYDPFLSWLYPKLLQPFNFIFSGIDNIKKKRQKNKENHFLKKKESLIMVSLFLFPFLLYFSSFFLIPLFIAWKGVHGKFFYPHPQRYDLASRVATSQPLDESNG